MPNLVTAEREKYEAAWALDAYAKNSPGAQLVPMFEDMALARPGATVLDAGCGSGKGGLALSERGYLVTMCDLTDEGVVQEAKGLPFRQAVLWHSLKPVARSVGRDWFDYVYCCDVLEHIPTPFAMLVVSRLLDISRSGVFMSISTVHDQFGSFVGEPLHHTVQPFVAWRDQLNAIGTVVEARDLLISATFFVRAK